MNLPKSFGIILSKTPPSQASPVYPIHPVNLSKSSFEGARKPKSLRGEFYGSRFKQISSARLAYFVDEPIADSFAEAIEDTDLLVVPTVWIYEVFKVILRERGQDAAFSAVAAMHQGTLVDLDAGLAMEAAASGLEEGLAFADSVIYAVAKKHDAMLWTQEADFEGKPGVRFKAKATGA